MIWNQILHPQKRIRQETYPRISRIYMQTKVFIGDDYDRVSDSDDDGGSDDDADNSGYYFYILSSM